MSNNVRLDVQPFRRPNLQQSSGDACLQLVHHVRVHDRHLGPWVLEAVIGFQAKGECERKSSELSSSIYRFSGTKPHLVGVPPPPAAAAVEGAAAALGAATRLTKGCFAGSNTISIFIGRSVDKRRG